MPQVVEINLRLPSFRTKATQQNEATSVNNSEVRFIKRQELEAIPQPGETLTLSADGTLSFPCIVVQVNWQESKNMFVLACRYGNQRISAEDYAVISNAPDWTSRPLL